MTRAWTWLLALALLLAACGARGGAGPKSAPASGSSVSFEVVQAAQLKDPARAWLSASRQRPGVAVWREGDQVYLLAAAGQKPTAGYAVNISGVRLVGDQLQVTVATSGPKPGEQAAQVLSYPKLAVSVLGRLPELQVVYRFGAAGAWEDAEVLRPV